jgi:hypothetical protein
LPWNHFKTELHGKYILRLLFNVSFKINEDINEILYNFEVSDIEDVKLKNYVDLLNNYKQKTNNIYESIENSLKYLQTLQENYSHVSEKTNSLHNACEQILSDQVSGTCLEFGLIFKYKQSRLPY